eukprot:TRINITY_DN25070_c0_g1_i1.p1 TRINITY_DN25070_c0_g1~~TRINITY_DN25070_c0_g1_i1.p1  ORF type:complete len:628 (+),score=197.90 TRINITY_DN25070_c0_g1_i1:59-1942(+)
MGCGGSAQAQEPAKEKTADKYKEDEKKDKGGKNGAKANDKGAAAATPDNTPDAPKSPRSPKSPRGKKKNKNGRKDGEMFKKVPPVISSLVASDVPSSVTSYLHPCQFVEIQPDRKVPDQPKFDFMGVCLGGTSVIRGPPGDPDAGGRTVSVVSDLCPRFSLNMSQEEAAAFSIDEASHKAVMADALNPIKLLIDRTAKTKYDGCSIRSLPGYNRPIAAIAISSDERSFTVCMGKGKPIVVRDNGVGLQMFGGTGPPPGGGGGSRQQSGAGGSRTSSFSSLTGHLRMERLAKIIRCHDFRTGQTTGMLKQKALEPETTTDMLFANEDQHLVTCTSEGCVFIWNMGRMKLHKQLEVGVEYNPCTKLHQVRISPNGKLVASCGEDIDDDGKGVGQVAVWETDTAKQVNAFTGHKSPAFALGFHPNSEHIISGEKKGTIILWVALTGEVLKRVLGHTQPVRSVWFNGERSFFSVDERFIRLWNVEEDDGDFTPVFTKHIDNELGEKFVSPTDEEIANMEAEAEDQEEDDEEDGDEKQPSCPSYLQMNPPPRQSKLRQRLVVPLPCGLLLSCISTREVQVIDGASGDVVEKVWTKAPVSCAAGGRSTAVLGDVFGNVYCLDFKMKHMLPTYV